MRIVMVLCEDACFLGSHENRLLDVKSAHGFIRKIGGNKKNVSNFNLVFAKTACVRIPAIHRTGIPCRFPEFVMTFAQRRRLDQGIYKFIDALGLDIFLSAIGISVTA